MRVLVTGAGGFIGAATVAALRAAGHDVQAGVRRGAAGAVLCDLDDPATLDRALPGVDLVVHCAYGDIAAMPAQARALLDAMTRAGAARLVTLSSIAVYGVAEGRLDESAALGARDPYGAAKVACEAQARRWATGPRQAVILRPGVVYGAGSRFWIDKLAERIRAGAWGDFGAAGEGLAALIHVDDLAGMIVRLVARPPEGACVALNAVGPETPSWNAYFAALSHALARPLPAWGAAEIRRRRRWATPAKLWRRLGLPGARAFALAPTRAEWTLFGRRAVYCTQAALRLGLAPRIGLAEGLRRSRLAGP